MISLTFDDGLHQHLDQAIPVLDEFGLRGTFYAHLSSEPFMARVEEWKSAAKQHELGNHSVFHPADAAKAWVSPGNAINLYTLDRMELELKFANAWLQTLDGQIDRTYAFPCSNMTLGDWGLLCKNLFRIGLRNTRFPGIVERLRLDYGNTRQDFRPLAAKLFVAARTGGIYLNDCSPPVKTLKQECLPSAAVEGHSFSEIREFIERSLAADGWPILQFHGIGGGHRMDCSGKVFRDTIKWISETHLDEIVTVVEGAKLLFPGKNWEVAN